MNKIIEIIKLNIDELKVKGHRLGYIIQTLLKEWECMDTTLLFEIIRTEYLEWYKNEIKEDMRDLSETVIYQVEKMIREGFDLAHILSNIDDIFKLNDSYTLRVYLANKFLLIQNEIYTNNNTCSIDQKLVFNVMWDIIQNIIHCKFLNK